MRKAEQLNPGYAQIHRNLAVILRALGREGEARGEEEAARRAIAEFDAASPDFYNEADRKRGRIVSTDRQGNVKEFPLLSVSIGICHNANKRLESLAQVSQLGAELKKAAKELPGSKYLVDRRRKDG